MDLKDLVAFARGCILLGVSQSTANRRIARKEPGFPLPEVIDGRRFYSVAEIERYRVAEYEKRRVRAGLAETRTAGTA